MDMVVILPLILIMGAFMFFASRKQKKAMQATIDLHESLQIGDRVHTTSGLQATITGITDSPATGALSVGKTVALTLAFNEIVTVSGGKPTLTLNDGCTATYASGSGTNALTFTYTVAAGQNAASLAATAVNLPSGVTIKDSAGSAASLSPSGLTQSGPQIDTAAPAAPEVRKPRSLGLISTVIIAAVALAGPRSRRGVASRTRR